MARHVALAVGEPSRPGTPGEEFYAPALGDHGRPRSGEPRNVILAVVAWWAGERMAGKRGPVYGSDDSRIERRRRVCRVLNRALLNHDETRMIDALPEEGSAGGKLWGHARDYGRRFDRARAYIQDDAPSFP